MCSGCVELCIVQYFKNETRDRKILRKSFSFSIFMCGPLGPPNSDFQSQCCSSNNIQLLDCITALNSDPCIPSNIRMMPPSLTISFSSYFPLLLSKSGDSISVPAPEGVWGQETLPHHYLRGGAGAGYGSLHEGNPPGH